MKVSKYSVAYLNRQSVVLLAHAGVSETILETMFATTIAEVKRLSTCSRSHEGHIDESIFADAHVSAHPSPRSRLESPR